MKKIFQILFLLTLITLPGCNDEPVTEKGTVTLLGLPEYEGDCAIHIRRKGAAGNKFRNMAPVVVPCANEICVPLEVGYEYELYPLIPMSEEAREYDEKGRGMHYHKIVFYFGQPIPVVMDEVRNVGYIPKSGNASYSVHHKGVLSGCNYEIKKCLASMPIDTLLSFLFKNEDKENLDI